jgi:hypothetical protein
VTVSGVDSVESYAFTYMNAASGKNLSDVFMGDGKRHGPAYDSSGALDNGTD